MSNYWNLTCRTCGQDHHLGWNNAGEEIQGLVGMLPELAKAAPVLNRLQEMDWRFDMEFPYGLLGFAVQHDGHDLIAVDEYGTYFDACGQYYRCPCCNHPSHCKLPPHGPDTNHGQLPKPEGGAR